MILNKKTFDRVRDIAKKSGYPTEFLAYYSGDTIKDGNKTIPVVWFKVHDGKVWPKKGQLIAMTEDFDLYCTRPYCYLASGRNVTFKVACSKSGRTISKMRG